MIVKWTRCETFVNNETGSVRTFQNADPALDPDVQARVLESTATMLASDAQEWHRDKHHITAKHFNGVAGDLRMIAQRIRDGSIKFPDAPK